ncbi:hypothetical protein [Streptomyces sp. NRRL WC-3742]|uniref:hypothetical protein n=1 Tax=Streptomyces sp. NRRL WC-3742 TaxID=1463934 RepID=UPI0004C672D4|nr:hypothetical protein [Streptomyces sp. NRRL WC-3742]
MGEGTIKVDPDGIKDFVGDLQTFRDEVGTKSATITNHALLPGNDSFQPVKTLRDRLTAYRTSLTTSMGTIHDAIDKVVVDLQNANTRLGEGEHSAWTEANMMQILSDVLNGGGGGSTGGGGITGTGGGTGGGTGT